MLSKSVSELLTDWADHGWLRPLDRAFALFLKAQEPDAHHMVLLGAALASHQLGRGHICLDLGAAVADPDATLSLPPEGETGDTLPLLPSELLGGISRNRWEEFLERSALVEAVNTKKNDPSGSPLVLSDGRLYLRRYWTYTLQVGDGISRRLSHSPAVPEDLLSRLDLMFHSLRSKSEQEKTEVHWQSVAAAIAAKNAFSIISGGPGTGKTTTVVQLLGLLQGIALEGKNKLRIRLAAPTGKAAARLTESIGGAVDRLPESIQPHMPTEVTTLHRLLGSRPDTRHFVHNARNRLHVDLLVVDEASMIDLEMMAALLQALPENARLILLGDKDQLASVEAGSVLGDLCRHGEKGCYTSGTISWLGKNTGYALSGCDKGGTELAQHIVVLRKSHRFGEKSGIGALSRAVNAGAPEQVENVWKNNFTDIRRLKIDSADDDKFAALILEGGSRGFSDSAPSDFDTSDPPVGYCPYLKKIHAGFKLDSLSGEEDVAGALLAAEDAWLREVLESFGRFQLLTPLRKGEWGVEGINHKAAQIFYKKGLISATEGWYPGRPVMVTRNDYSLGLMNGDIGILLPVMGSGDPDKNRDILKVVFPMPDGTLKKVLPSRLNDVETVFVMTVHKSQGSEFEHTALVMPEALSPVMTRELVYTGITRARRYFTLIGPRLELLGECVKRRTLRASGLWERFLDGPEISG